jgi:outer membrane protein TolC
LEKAVPHVSFVFRIWISLAAIAACFALDAAAQPAPLTLDEAIELAAQRSRQLDAESAAAGAARDLADAAEESPDPTLTAAMTNVPVNGPDAFSLTRDFMTMISIGWSQELRHGDKRDARATRYRLEADAAEASRVSALSELQRGAASAWLERYYDERVGDLLRRQRDEAALQIEAADLAFRSGSGPQSDVFAARSAAAKIDDRIAANARDVEVATARLERWIDDAARRPLGAPPVTDRVPREAAELGGELLHHPEIRLMAKQEEIARADAEIARTDKRSDWTVGVMYSKRGPDFSDMMSVNVSKPLQFRERNRQDREVAAKLALAERLHAERDEATREHVAETHEMLSGWNRDRERLGRYASTLIPLALERASAALAAYRSGTGTLASVLDARAAELETRIDQLALEMETAGLWAQLNYLLPAGVAHE